MPTPFFPNIIVDYYEYINSMGELNEINYINASHDTTGNTLHHFAWVEFINDQLNFAAHRWYLGNASIAYQQTLYTKID